LTSPKVKRKRQRRNRRRKLRKLRKQIAETGNLVKRRELIAKIKRISHSAPVSG
jgi:hypothetical protein